MRQIIFYISLQTRQDECVLMYTKTELRLSVKEQYFFRVVIENSGML